MKAVNISKSYGSKVVLNDCSLDIPKGNIQALLGRNGAGKTTFVNIMADIIPPNSGYVEIDNVKVSPTQFKYRQNVGYLIEENLLINNLTAIEYLQLMGAFYNLKKEKLNNRILYLTDYFQLPSNSTLIRKYSKGMKAKLNLAAALVHEPKILILDEPFSALDFPSIQKLSKLLRKIASEGGEILIASHQYEVIADVCNKFALIENGKILFNLPMNELKERARKIAGGSVKNFLENQMAD